MDHLIKSYALFKQSGHAMKLVLYGNEQGQLAMMERLLEELGLQDDIEIHCFTSNPAEVFRESKASLLTSEFEGFGLTVMESINVGCPVISYDVKYGPREIIAHGENGYLVPAYDMESFAQAMVQLVEQPLERVETKPSRLAKGHAVDGQLGEDDVDSYGYLQIADQPVERLATFPGSYAMFYEQLAEGLRGGRVPVDLRDAEKTKRLIEAVRNSRDEGRRLLRKEWDAWKN
jgi:hypothetical protein